MESYEWRRFSEFSDFNMQEGQGRIFIIQPDLRAMGLNEIEFWSDFISLNEVLHETLNINMLMHMGNLDFEVTAGNNCEPKIAWPIQFKNCGGRVYSSPTKKGFLTCGFCKEEIKASVLRENILFLLLKQMVIELEILNFLDCHLYDEHNLKLLAKTRHGLRVTDNEIRSIRDIGLLSVIKYALKPYTYIGFTVSKGTRREHRQNHCEWLALLVQAFHRRALEQRKTISQKLFGPKPC